VQVQNAVFSGIGILSTTQEIAGTVLSVMPEADAELVAEETLCLLATVSARACQAAGPEHEALARSCLAAPFLYRDYLVGTAMLESNDPAAGQLGETIGERLERKMAFYVSHLEAGRLPSPEVLRDKMLLWMGRISPPKMPSGPEERLDGLPVVDRVMNHARLLGTRVRHSAGNDPSQAV